MFYGGTRTLYKNLLIIKISVSIGSEHFIALFVYGLLYIIVNWGYVAGQINPIEDTIHRGCVFVAFVKVCFLVSS